MTLYEQVLNKISPLFYKLTRYQDYYEKNYYSFIASFLGYTKTPEVYHLYIMPRYSYYYFSIKKPIYRISDKNISAPYNIYIVSDIYTVSLTERKAQSRYDIVSHIELIVNAIINNFYLENKKLPAPYLVSAEGLEKVFIKLVGRELYDALRSSIK
ncbi:MAG: hypothetical protein RXR31_01670 [Thermoproteota archaeon]